MTAALDPFQLIRAVSLQREQIEVSGIWRIFSIDSSPQTYSIGELCRDGDTIQIFDVYWHQIFGTFPSPVSADQLPMEIRQGAGDWYSVVSPDYGFTSESGGFPCWYEYGNAWVRSSGSWDPSSEEFEFSIDWMPYFVTGLSTTTYEARFSAAEKQSIILISERTASTVNVDIPGHGYPDQSTVTIEGTESYDGGYIINYLTADRFWITASYVANEAAGTAQSSYS